MILDTEVMQPSDSRDVRTCDLPLNPSHYPPPSADAFIGLWVEVLTLPVSLY